MERREADLNGVEQYDRTNLLRVLVKRLNEALILQFPPEAGYQGIMTCLPAPCVNRKRKPGTGQTVCMMAAWDIQRGPFWGLHVRAMPQDVALRTLKITIEGYFPAIQRPAERLEGLFNFPGQALLAHFILPLLVVPVMALLPFMALHRLAKLRFRQDVHAVGRQLDSLWPEVQASAYSVGSLQRSQSPFVRCCIALVVAGGATAGCWWLTNLPNIGATSKTALYVAVGILGLVSLGLLVGLIMTMLGFEIEP